MDLSKDLANCFVITRDNGTKLLPGAARHRDSASGIILPTALSARELVDEIHANVGDQFGTVRYDQIKDPFGLMRRSSQEGIGSFDSTIPGFLENPLVFCTRATEIGDDLPTLLVDYAEKEDLSVLARSGPRMMKSVDVIPWRRFDISDPLLAIWSTNGKPFRDWDSGNPLVGLLIEGSVAVVRSCPLTQHWASLEGTIPIFTSETNYAYACRSGDLFSQLSLFGPFNSTCYQVLQSMQWGSMKIDLIKIDSLYDYLNDVCFQIPNLAFAQFSLNPFCHRENAAYGWIVNFLRKKEIPENQSEREPPPLELRSDKDWAKRFGQTTSFNTVLGEWTIDSTNIVSLAKRADSWTDRATLHWSGGPSIALENLSNSLAHLDQWSDFSDEEKNDALQTLFGEECENHAFDEEEYQGLSSQANLFAAKLWDTYTGDSFIVRFATPYEFILVLHKHLTEFDENIRIHGGRPCGSPVSGSTGSGDVDHERHRTKQAQSALFGIAKSMALSGYKPDKAVKICWIVNRLFETLHVDFSGYVKDLLVQCDAEDDFGSLCESLNIDEDETRQFKEDVVLQPPLEGLETLKGLIGRDGMAMLSPKATYFAANGLFDMSLKGESPHLDYSTISIEFVKALEVELGFLFRKWLSLLSLESVEIGSSRHESDVQAYLTKNRMFSLGSMGYLLGDVAKIIQIQEDSPETCSLLVAMASKVCGLEQMKPLLHNSFNKKFINRVSHSFRNGGAHDQKIPLATCIECQDSILGSAAAPGWLITVSQALASLNALSAGGF